METAENKQTVSRRKKPVDTTDRIERKIQRKDKHRRIEDRRRRSERKIFDELRQILGVQKKHRVAVLTDCLTIIQHYHHLKSRRPDLFSEVNYKAGETDLLQAGDERIN